jgi:hypothetical protein
MFETLTGPKVTLAVLAGIVLPAVALLSSLVILSEEGRRLCRKGLDIVIDITPREAGGQEP